MVKKIKKEAKDCCHKDKSPGALFIPAGVIIGVGVGFFIGELVGATLVGLGLGFLGFAVYEIITRIGK